MQYRVRNQMHLRHKGVTYGGGTVVELDDLTALSFGHILETVPEGVSVAESAEASTGEETSEAEG